MSLICLFICFKKVFEFKKVVNLERSAQQKGKDGR
jgi:hypothetical protein